MLDMDFSEYVRSCARCHRWSYPGTGTGIPKNTSSEYRVIDFTDDTEEHGEARYRISEAAHELGISIVWLRVGEKRGFFPPAHRDRNGHRYYTEEDIERMRNRPTSRKTRQPTGRPSEVRGETVGPESERS